MTSGPNRHRALSDFQRSLEFGCIYFKNGAAASQDVDTSRPVRILTWNIGLGRAPGSISEVLRTIRPDVACLQEVDWGNRRTGGQDVLLEIAKATEMIGVYRPEQRPLLSELSRRGHQVDFLGASGRGLEQSLLTSTVASPPQPI